MADDVEAELEAPEALEIAKEDILLSKMEQERERWVRQHVAGTTQTASSVPSSVLCEFQLGGNCLGRGRRLRNPRRQRWGKR